jgi:hypothetical protein
MAAILKNSATISLIKEFIITGLYIVLTVKFQNYEKSKAQLG